MRIYINYNGKSIYLSEEDIDFLLGADHFEKQFDYFFMGSWDCVNFYFSRILQMKIEFTHTPIYKMNEELESIIYDEIQTYIESNMPDTFFGEFEILYKKEQEREINKDEYPAWAIE